MPCVTEPTPWTPTSRRTLGKAAVAATVAVGAVGAAVRLSQDDDPKLRPGGALALSADDGSDVAALETGLRLQERSSGVLQSEALPTSTYSMAAVTWARPEDRPEVLVRARRSDGWSDWTRLPVVEDRPDDDPAVRTGTAAWWFGPSDAVQVRLSRGPAPKGMRLVLLHPASRPDDELSPRTAARRSTGTPKAPRPDIRTRKQWGADESWRDGSPRTNRTIEQVHVHHTVSGNTYSRKETAALIRGMYRYHTKSLGWSDIGYNFLVDRFGRIWEGRAGGIAQPVRGAHTLGFNDTSMGVSVIGNFEQAAPSEAIIDALGALAAWKLDAYDRRPRGRTTVESTGSDKYAAGRMATLRVIDGHRDTNDTACPGSKLYARLDDVRDRAHRVIKASRAGRPVDEPEEPEVVGVVEPARVGGVAKPGKGLKVVKGRYDPDGARSSYQWLRDGDPIAGETAWRYRLGQADLGRRIAVQVTTRSGSRTPALEVTPARRVTSPVVLEVNARRTRGVVRAKIRLRSPEGLDREPTGTVTVSIGNRTEQVRVRDLGKPVWFGRGKKLAKSATRLVVRYEGDAAFRPAERTLDLPPTQR